METKRNILLVYTGGTIGMMKNETTGALEPYKLDHLYQQIPELNLYPHKIDFYSFEPLIDSSDMNPDFWVKLAKLIASNYTKYDGFVILHGTDTMAYTASMLSFMFNNLNKPIILTGSQLPMGMLRTDGRENFLTAMELVAKYKDDKPLIPEVGVYFENNLFRGNRVTKFNSKDFDAFLSGNYPTLVDVGIEIKYNYNYIKKYNNEEFSVHYKLDTNISVLKLYPGITKNAVNSILNIEGLKGVILETFGAGNAPSDKWFIDELKDAIRRGILIYNVTQCKEGGVDAIKYQAGLQLKNIGVISGHDITTESAIAKMMYLFGRYSDLDKISELLSIPLRGEMSV